MGTVTAWNRAVTRNQRLWSLGCAHSHGLPMLWVRQSQPQSKVKILHPMDARSGELPLRYYYFYLIGLTEAQDHRRFENRHLKKP